MTPGAGLLVATSGVNVSAGDVALLVVVLVLLAASAMLALAETSLVRMSRAKAMALVDDGRRGARVLVRLTENPQGFLNPLLLLVLICQLVVATLVGVLAASWFGAWGVLAATVFEIVVIFVLGEAVPKNWAVHHPERAALLSAPLVSALVGFWPIRMVSSALIGLANLLIGQKGGYLGSHVTESELLAMADVALEGDVIETEERALIHSIIEFGDTVVREVMVPRPDMVTIGAGETVEAVLARALEAGFSRLPAVEQHVDDVVGIAYTKDMIRTVRMGKGGDAVRSHLRVAHFVPETKRVSDMMRVMQAEKFHLAVVVNEYGGTGHARGPDRGAGWGDRRRVRRRGGAGGEARLGRVAGERPAARRRGQRTGRCPAPHRCVGHGGRPGVRPVGARPRRR